MYLLCAAAAIASIQHIFNPLRQRFKIYIYIDMNQRLFFLFGVAPKYVQSSCPCSLPWSPLVLFGFGFPLCPHHTKLELGFARSLSVRCICANSGSKFGLPLVSVGQQLLCGQKISMLFDKNVPLHFTHPCCTTALLWSRWHTRRWETQQWRRRGKTPGRSRSRCTWSCRYRSGWCDEIRQHALRLQL